MSWLRCYLAVAAFEARDKMRSISTHVFFGIYFAITALLMALIGGAFTGASATALGGGGNVLTNGPWMITILGSIVGLFAILVTPAIAGHAIYRDFQANIHGLLFTTPLPKWAYWFGRLTGALVATAWVYAAIPIAQALTCHLVPTMDQEHLGPFDFGAYLSSYALLLTMAFFVACLFFSLAALTRSMLPNYVGGAALFVGYFGAQILMQNPENKQLAALLDPFGLAAYGMVTEYWTAVEKNSLLPPLWSVLGANRLIWCSVGALVAVVAGWRFRLSALAGDRKGRASAPAEAGPAVIRPGVALQLPDVTIRHDGKAQLVQLASVIKRSLAAVLFNVYFMAIAAIGILFLFLFSTQVGRLYGTPTWPVTYQVLGVLGGTFGIFVIIVLTFFAGELVWQERELRLSQIVDASPAPTWASIMGKIVALWAVLAILQIVMIPAGMIVQAAHGYTRFEPLLYLFVQLGLRLPTFMLFAVLAVLVQVIVNHKYLGHAIVVALYLTPIVFGLLNWEHSLLQYAGGPGWQYSDMSGFGATLGPVAWFKAFWTAVATILFVVASLFWVRGQETGMAQRLGLAKGRLGKGSVAVVAAALLVVLGLGGYIFYNTNVLNEYSTSKEREDQVAEYERKYRQYLRLPQPRVTAVDVRADLSPREGAIRFQGTYALKNKTGAPIPKLHVLIGGEPEEYELAFTPPATLEMEDEVSGYRIYALSQPLAPGAAMECRFDVAYGRKGFTNGGIDGTVIENGTFVNSGLLPSFGYEPNAELSDDDVRKKHALEPKPRMNPMSDAVARNDNYLSRDADWIDFKTTVCTSPDQIALAPGYLEREWDEDGKRCFAFAMDAPILHFFAMLSARFEVKKDSWTSPSGQVVAIEVYHHSGHPYNIEGMIEAVKKTLDYDTREFGPYQHRQLRIVEFPLGYGTFAQSFPNTVPFSEAIGFIARPDKDEDIDYTFYVTAHEVSHQWFAHQVIGANVQGATVTSESLSQYAALMVMEHEYGRPSMRKFLKHELSGYLIGRSGERKAENPLAMNENQQYIHYQKGSLVMYALREWMGEDQLNLALRNYLAKVKFQEPPYTTSLEMLDEIKAVAAPELHPFIDDLFLKISLWDLRMKEATWEKRPDGQYDVTMSWEAKQLQADAKGTETEVPLDLAIPVGVFLGTPKDLEELWFEKVPMKAGPGTLTVTVPKQPERVGIDPYHYLVDRNLDDNLAQVEEKSAVSS